MGVNVTLGSNGVGVGVSQQASGVYSLANLISAMPAAVKRLCVYAQPTEAEALQDLIGSFDAVNNGCTFSANIGFTGDGVSAELQTNYNAGDDGTWTDQSWFGWVKISSDTGIIHSVIDYIDPNYAAFDITSSYSASTDELELKGQRSDLGETCDFIFYNEPNYDFQAALDDLDYMFICYQFRGGNVELFINGALVAQIPNTIPVNSDGGTDATELNSSTSTLAISANGDALTPTEVKTVYNACKYYMNRNNQDITNVGTYTIDNSDASYSTSVSADTTLPDITITQADDTTTTAPSVKDLDVDNYLGSVTILSPSSTWDEMVAELGLGYLYPLPTGQSTSYRTGDDAWIKNNIFTVAVRGANDKKIKNSLSDWTTLQNNNAFGNTNRWTDDAGGQTYSNNYVIDHITGLGWLTVLQSQDTWNNAIDAAQAATDLTFTDWFIPTRNQISTIHDSSLEAQGSYSLVDIFSAYRGTTAQCWTSTTYTLASTNAWAINRVSTASVTSKTNNRPYYFCRKHY